MYVFISTNLFAGKLYECGESKSTNLFVFLFIFYLIKIIKIILLYLFT